jgi:tRNA modification GTPase
MAGLRPTGDAIEALGVERARERAAAAEVRVFLVDPGDEIADLGVAATADDVTVTAKADLYGDGRGPAVSGLTGEGVGELLERLKEILSERVCSAGLVSHERQRSAIAAATAALEDAVIGLAAGCCEAELVAADLHRAVRALEVLVGKSDIEAVLDVIFQSFCLGK